MGQENKGKVEEKMRERLKRPLVLSAESEKRIQAAYKKVREECEVQNMAEKRKNMERQDKSHKMVERIDNGNQEGKVRLHRGHSLRRMAVVAAAAVMIMATGLVAAAAMGYFSKTVKEDKGKAVYEFAVNYELQPVEVKVKAGYLPAGMEEHDIGKYWTEENPGHGISVSPLNVVNIDQIKKNLSFDYVENIERTTIQGMEAHVITFQDEEKYDRGKGIFLFNAEQGFVIWIHGDTIVPLEEVRKVAENLEITVTENTDLSYDLPEDTQAKDAMEDAYQKKMEELVARGLKEEELTPLGEELDCEFSGCKIKVEDVQILDSLYDIPGYTEAGVCEMEWLAPWLETDGTHKPYLRTHYGKDGEILGEETVSCRFMAVKVVLNQYGESGGSGTAVNGSLKRMSKSGDGTYHWKEDFYLAVPGEGYSLQMDNMAFYFDQPENLEGDKRAHSFFFRNLKPGDMLTYTLVFAVDEDILADKSSELLLEFDATQNIMENPMYSKLK